MDTRYLKRRGQRWYFQLAVPHALHATIGRKVIVEALNTSTLAEAQQLRWKRLATAHSAFEAASQPAAVTPAAIEREAQATLSRLLREADAAGSRGEPLQWAAPDAAAHGNWPDGITEGEGLTFALETFAEAMRTRNYALVEVEAAAVVISLNLGRDPHDDELDALCQSQLAAHYEAIKARLARLRGQDYLPSEPLAQALKKIHGGGALGTAGRPFDRTVVQSQTGDGIETETPRLSEAAAACVAAHARAGDDERIGGWSAQTCRQYAGIYDLLARFKADAPLATVTAQDAATFIDGIAGLNPYWRRAPGADELAFGDLVTRHSKPPGLSRKTVDRYVAAGFALFAWAAEADHFHGQNPFAGLAGSTGLVAEQPGRPFNDVELADLMTAPVFQRPPAAVDSMDAALVWSVFLALFGGLRLEEICRLRPGDIRLEDGAWLIDAGGRPRRRGRPVPMHDALVAMGFLDHVRQVERLGADYVLPAVAAPAENGAARLTRAFVALRRRQGLVAANRQGYRTLRATARAALVRARVGEAIIAHLLGDGRRRRGPSMSDLAAGINRIAYPVDLSGVLPSNRN